MLSPTQIQALILLERAKPTLQKLYARLRAQQHHAIGEAPDWETCMRWLDQAELEYLRPQIDHYQRLRQLKDVNRPRFSRRDAWQGQARERATTIWGKRRFARLSILRLTQKLVGVDVWPTTARFRFSFDGRTETISAARLYDFLRIEYPGSPSQ